MNVSVCNVVLRDEARETGQVVGASGSLYWSSLSGIVMQGSVMIFAEDLKALPIVSQKGANRGRRE